MCNWDNWRANYPTMSYIDQQAFHRAIYAAYPEQRHFDTDQCAQAIELVNPVTVVELGGWDGELAEAMLKRFQGISKWTNVELCKEAREAGKDRVPGRYVAWDVDDWYWSRTWDCDLLVASHVIEHLTSEDLQKVLDSTNALGLFFDAPLDDQGHEWPGFTGTHILPLGWIGVNALCAQRGYMLAFSHDHETDPSSGGKARACLYLHEDHAL